VVKHIWLTLGTLRISFGSIFKVHLDDQHSIVKIDSIIGLSVSVMYVEMVYLIWVRKLDPRCVKVTASKDLVSEILNEINTSCCTEYKAFGIH